MYRSYMSVRKRNYALTFFTEPEIEEPGPLVYFVYGREVCPNTEKVHWQAYAQFNCAMTYGQIKKLFKDKTIHIEEEHYYSSPQRNVDYCEKGTMSSELFKTLKEPREHPDFGIDAEVYEWGEMKIQGKRNDIHEIKEKVKDGQSMIDIIESTEKLSYQTIRCAELLGSYLRKPRPIGFREVIWCFGETETRKTSFAYQNYPEIYEPLSAKWWDGYDGQKTVIIDDIRDEYSYKQLLRMTDIYPFKVERKGGSTEALYDVIIFTCPWSPMDFMKRYFSASDNYNQLMRRITKILEFTKEIDCPVEETFVYKCTEVRK